MKLIIPALMALVASALALPTDSTPSNMRRQQIREACREKCLALGSISAVGAANCVIAECATKVRYLSL